MMDTLFFFFSKHYSVKQRHVLLNSTLEKEEMLRQNTFQPKTNPNDSHAQN